MSYNGQNNVVGIYSPNLIMILTSILIFVIEFGFFLAILFDLIKILAISQLSVIQTAIALIFSGGLTIASRRTSGREEVKNLLIYSIILAFLISVGFLLDVLLLAEIGFDLVYYLLPVLVTIIFINGFISFWYNMRKK